MKRYGTIILLLAIVCGVVGCSFGDAEDEVAPITLVVQYQQLKNQYDHLAYQMETQKMICDDTIQQLQQGNEDLINQALQYQQEYNDLASIVENNRAELAKARGEATALGQEAFNLREELAKGNNSLNTLHQQYQELMVMLVACTPRDFASLMELEEWRIEKKDFGDNTIANCRRMQKSAWASGFILSVRLGVPSCIAFIGDSIYKVLPAYDTEVEDEEDFVCVWKVD